MGPDPVPELHQGVEMVIRSIAPAALIESSKSEDIGIYYGLSFLWNAESPKNLQQTKAEEVRNSESTEDSNKFQTHYSYRRR